MISGREQRQPGGGNATAHYTPSVGNLLVWVPSEKGKNSACDTQFLRVHILCPPGITLSPGTNNGSTDAISAASFISPGDASFDHLTQ